MNDRKPCKPGTSGSFAKRGFTLVEVVVVVLLLSTGLTIGIRLWSMSQASQQRVGHKLALQFNSRQAADVLVDKIREASEVVRPSLGETLPFLVAKDTRNLTTMFYLERDTEGSIRSKRVLNQLVTYTASYDGSYSKTRERIIIKGLKQLQFTCVSPGSVQIEAIMANEKEEFQFLSHVALMNLGEIE